MDLIGCISRQESRFRILCCGRCEHVSCYHALRDVWCNSLSATPSASQAGLVEKRRLQPQRKVALSHDFLLQGGKRLVIRRPRP
jgi:hypothetical protein